MIPNPSQDPQAYAKWLASIKPLPTGTILRYEGKIFMVTATRSNPNIAGNRVADSIVELTRSTKGGAKMAVGKQNVPLVHIARALALGNAEIIKKPGDAPAAVRAHEI